MVLTPLVKERGASALGYLSLAGCVAALAASVAAYANPGPAFQDMLIVDGFATFFRVLVIAVGILTVAFLLPVSAPRGNADGRVLRAAAVLGGRPVRHGGGQRPDHDLHRPRDLLDRQLRAGGLSARRPRANEAALKYFLLGSFATAFLLYGVAWIYGIDRLDLPGGHPGLALRRRPGGLADAGGDRGGPDVRRIGLQGLRLALPGLGARTSTRARRRRSPRSCPPDPRPRPSPSSCASS